jgi:hypothetical protein
LPIVATLAARWNFFPAPQGGKVVWAELAIPAHPRTAAGLPQRVRPSLAGDGNRHRGVIRDPVLLARIHRSLKSL